MPAGGTVTIKTENVPSSSLNPGHLPPGSGDFVLLTVHDEGAVIPEDARNTIFDPFCATRKIGRGGGLGLSIVYVLVKNCGGKVRFESDDNMGTKFFVYLPVKKE
jgi:two-component system, cell cycle sensor histidine kinase and response regulator CckA